jgi:hypothetical protein
MGSLERRLLYHHVNQLIKKLFTVLGNNSNPLMMMGGGARKITGISLSKICQIFG